MQSKNCFQFGPPVGMRGRTGLKRQPHRRQGWQPATSKFKTIITFLIKHVKGYTKKILDSYDLCVHFGCVADAQISEID